jgi:hypothetical protein
VARVLCGKSEDYNGDLRALRAFGHRVPRAIVVGNDRQGRRAVRPARELDSAVDRVSLRAIIAVTENAYRARSGNEIHVVNADVLLQKPNHRQLRAAVEAVDRRAE